MTKSDIDFTQSREFRVFATPLLYRPRADRQPAGIISFIHIASRRKDDAIAPKRFAIRDVQSQPQTISIRQSRSGSAIDGALAITDAAGAIEYETRE